LSGTLDAGGPHVAEAARKSARPPLLLIALVFFGPLLVAAWMYYGGYFDPASNSSHGALLEPIISLADELSDSEVLAKGKGSWILLYSNDSACDETCQQALYTMRQGRLMLGKEQNRLLRAFLHGDSPPDKVFLASEHQGLITTQDAQLSAVLNNKKPAELPDGGYYLVDPLGNLVMYFRPDLNPSEMVDDIKRLLRLSRIG
jgi:cytochrome oxidase Cu insertion factor (SCO1/SenC/PrrC family)